VSQQEVISALEAAGVLGGVRWAYDSATARTLETYSEADGHDAGWFGTTRYTYFKDRLDRVFCCERYALPEGRDPWSSLDLLHAELSEHDIELLPHLAPELVARSNFNGSPGWAFQGWRFLLASCDVGKLDCLPWPQKSPTKQRVARQPSPDPDQGSLFDDTEDEELAGLIALMTQPLLLDLTTYVVAHTLDPVSHERELAFGSPRLNAGGGEAWNWREDLLKALPDGGGRRATPTPTGPDDEPDAPVRLRQPAEKQDGGQADGSR
jgi:hypothetical protein